MRHLIPLIPIMAIYGASSIDYLPGLRKIIPRYRVLFFIAILPLLAVYQVQQLQKDQIAIQYSITKQEDFEVKRVAAWLKSYLAKERISDFYFPGEIYMIDRITRHLSLYLPDHIKYHIIIANRGPYKVGGHQPLDVGTYTITPFIKGNKGIFISKTEYNKTNNRLNYGSYTLLKTEPFLSLYVYRLENSDKI